MSEDLVKELRELEVGTFEIEDVAEVGVYAADELLMLDDGTDLFAATSCSSSSCSTGSTSSCSTSCTSSTCSTCSCC